MGYNPVPMLTINKLTGALASIGRYLDHKKPATLNEANHMIVLASMVAHEATEETAAEIDAIKNGTFLTN